MKSFSDLDKMIDFQLKHKLGDKIFLYHTTDSLKQIDDFFITLGGESVTKMSYTFPATPKEKTEIYAKIFYFGIDIFIINIDDL